MGRNTASRHIPRHRLLHASSSPCDLWVSLLPRSNLSGACLQGKDSWAGSSCQVNPLAPARSLAITSLAIVKLGRVAFNAFVLPPKSGVYFHSHGRTLKSHPGCFRFFFFSECFASFLRQKHKKMFAKILPISIFLLQSPNVRVQALLPWKGLFILAQDISRMQMRVWFFFVSLAKQECFCSGKFPFKKNGFTDIPHFGI